METKWHLIGRGKNGWYASAPNVSSSGGDIVPRIWPYDGKTIPPYQANAIEGALVYDADDADYGAYATHVIKGPMVDHNLDPEGWQKFGHKGEEYRSLDYVGIARFERLLRAIPGIKFGKVHNGEIEWEQDNAG